MREKSKTENGYMQGRTGADCCAGSGIGKKQYRYFTCVFAVFLLIACSILSSPLSAATTNAQASIAAGVAAGTDTSVILRNAMADGLTLEQAVREMVMAGADPGRVVYDAITADFASESVVKGAAAAARNKYCEGTDVTTTACTIRMSMIVSAAQQAGASPDDVNNWLAGAGVPASLVASSNTQSSQSPYRAPSGGTALTSITGGGGVTIGGSTIGSPLNPTKPASPTTP